MHWGKGHGCPQEGGDSPRKPRKASWQRGPGRRGALQAENIMSKGLKMEEARWQQRQGTWGAGEVTPDSGWEEPWIAG